MNNILEDIISIVMNTNSTSPLALQLAKPQSQLNLHRELQHYAASSDGCSGYSGHCSCSNNPCMICSSAH